MVSYNCLADLTQGVDGEKKKKPQVKSFTLSCFSTGSRRHVLLFFFFTVSSLLLQDVRRKRMSRTASQQEHVI